MSTDPRGLALLLAAVAVESLGQMALKVGSAGRPRWAVLGVLLYVGEIALYTLALHRLPVSVAFPVGSLCFVGVAVLSRLFLGEAVGGIRWLGVGFIVAGAVLVTL
jgi:undecaprenyl phosphate-alpha-L-ara4N flippase subunit ArnE